MNLRGRRLWKERVTPQFQPIGVMNILADLIFNKEKLEIRNFRGELPMF